MLTIVKTIILGIIEGITEWLPVSSTGHLILFGDLLRMDMSEAFMELFNVVIQLGAILAVVLLFFRRLWPFRGRGDVAAESQFAHASDGAVGRFQRFADRRLYMDKIILWLKIAVSVLPSVVIGLPLDDWLDEHLYRPVPVAVMLILYGILFILIENRNSGRRPRVTSVRRITWRDALIIGMFQCLALIPGTSRSGATILGGILIGLSRTCAAEYTFFLAIPTMLGASLLKAVKYGMALTGKEALVLLIGCAVAFAVSFATIRFLMDFVRRHDFKPFAYYRIALGAAVLAAAFFGAA